MAIARIAHIVNPVIVSSSSDLFLAQPITFESMRIARSFAQDSVDVTLYSAQYASDHEIIPDDFQKTPDLQDSVLNFGRFQRDRKLPLLRDILDRLYAATDADYLIYTNVDIGLMPNFYLAVQKLIEQGYDAFVVNRRTISKTYQSPAELPLIYAQVGKPHGGHDCFIFKRDVYPYYELGTACIGAGRIGKVLLLNLICNAQKFIEIQDLHLTFHLGDDRVWKSPEFSDYFDHNDRELVAILKHYLEQESLPDHPIIQTLRDRYFAPVSTAPAASRRKQLRRIKERLKKLICG